MGTVVVIVPAGTTFALPSSLVAWVPSGLVTGVSVTVTALTEKVPGEPEKTSRRLFASSTATMALVPRVPEKSKVALIAAAGSVCGCAVHCGSSGSSTTTFVGVFAPPVAAYSIPVVVE